MELRDYLQIIRKRKWVILLVSLSVIIGYSIFFFTQSPSYTAQSRILLRLPPEWQDMPVISMPSWDTRISLIESKPVIEGAVEILRDEGMDVTAGEIHGGLSINPRENTDFVDLNYTSNDPDRAIEIANAVTQSFLEYDRNNNQQSLNSAEQTLQREVNRADQRLADLETRLSESREIADLSRHYRNTRENYESLQAQYGPKHPKIKEVRRAMAGLEADIRDAYVRYFPDRLETIKSDTTVAVDGGQPPIGQLLIDESDLSALQRRVQIANNRLNQRQNSLDQVSFNKSLLDRSASIISSPTSTSVSYPTTYQTYGFVILAGFILGVSTGSFLEYINDKIVTKFDIHRYLGLPVLGSIPEVEEDELNLLENPMKTPLSERYHAISVVLQYSLLKKQNRKSILVTSSVRGEGKSYTSLNLGVSLAREGEEVLLVDLDLRAPKLHKIFGLMNSRGVSNAITGDLELEHALQESDGEESGDSLSVSWEALDEVIEESPQPGLDVLPSGPLPSNPIKDIKSQYMEDMLAQVRNHYGLVVIDSPPLNSVIDSVVLSTLVDGVLMVVHSGGVRRGQAQHSKHLLEDVDVPILGTVLNQVTQELPAYYSYYDQPNAKSVQTR